MRKSLLNYSLYSHPEIGKFQGVTSLRQKGTYAPPQDQAWGLNIHDGK
jgi:hypothetical protein